MKYIVGIDLGGTNTKVGLVNAVSGEVIYSTSIKTESEKGIDDTFGSFEAFQEIFAVKALSVFGSGWAWLCLDKNNTLVIISTAGQNSPFSE